MGRAPSETISETRLLLKGLVKRRFLSIGSVQNIIPCHAATLAIKEARTQDRIYSFDPVVYSLFYIYKPLSPATVSTQSDARPLGRRALPWEISCRDLDAT